MESPESWFEDFGEARLVDGTANVPLIPVRRSCRGERLSRVSDGLWGVTGHVRRGTFCDCFSSP